jgi:hypothetical protein
MQQLADISTGGCASFISRHFQESAIAHRDSRQVIQHAHASAMASISRRNSAFILAPAPAGAAPDVLEASML